MEFVDGCLILKLKRYREITPDVMFFKSFIVKYIQEYEIKVIFHSIKFLEYRRYSQFRDFKEKVPNMQLPSSVQDKLPSFPKKKFMQKSSKLIEKRRIMLEKWLICLLQQKSSIEPLLYFLNILDPIASSVFSSPVCKFNQSEIAVATLLKNFNKIDKNGSKYLKDFDNSFFSHPELIISPISTSILLKTLIPLCANPSLAYPSIAILEKLLKIESYRQADSVQQILFNSLELLKEIKIENHILNKFSLPSGEIGFSIATIVKDYLDRNGMSHYFKYFLNFNEEAFEQFGVKIEGKTIEGKGLRDTTVYQKFLGDWRWLNTDGYSGGLKVGVRKMQEHFEVKAEVFIEASAQRVFEYLKLVEKRKEWDFFMDDMRVVKKIDDQKVVMWYSFKKDRKRTADLALECRIIQNLGQALIMFNSIGDELVPVSHGVQRVKCLESYYDVQSLSIKARRSSSTSEEVDSEEESIGSCQSTHSMKLMEENTVSKIIMFYKMQQDMARCFVDDISEETDVLKTSLMALKRLAENKKMF